MQSVSNNDGIETKFDVGIFTQPGPKEDILTLQERGLSRYDALSEASEARGQMRPTWPNAEFLVIFDRHLAGSEGWSS